EKAKLSVELSYTAGGKTITKTSTTRLTVLGRNDAAYTVLPAEQKWTTFYHQFQESSVVVTAFVTPNDPVIKDLKGELSKRIGGVATVTDDGAMKFAKAVYDYFRTNISYSSPATTSGAEGKLVQHLNYPRNVLKAGTGTCIDLAVTFASLAEAAG